MGGKAEAKGRVPDTPGIKAGNSAQNIRSQQVPSDPVLAFPFAQIAEPAYRQTAGILHPLLGQPADMLRKVAPRPQIQIMSGHATIDLHRSKERLCDFNLRHI
jgi:hypothetical protein